MRAFWVSSSLYLLLLCLTSCHNDHEEQAGWLVMNRSVACITVDGQAVASMCDAVGLVVTTELGTRIVLDGPIQYNGGDLYVKM